MTWVLVVGAGWLVFATLVAMLIGRAIRLADGRGDELVLDEPNFVAYPANGLDPVFEQVGPLPAPPAARQPEPSRPVRDAPTIPGLPVARPRVPGSTDAGATRRRRTGTD